MTLSRIVLPTSHHVETVRRIPRWPDRSDGTHLRILRGGPARRSRWGRRPRLDDWSEWTMKRFNDSLILKNRRRLVLVRCGRNLNDGRLFLAQFQWIGDGRPVVSALRKGDWSRRAGQERRCNVGDISGDGLVVCSVASAATAEERLVRKDTPSRYFRRTDESLLLPERFGQWLTGGCGFCCFPFGPASLTLGDLFGSLTRTTRHILESFVMKTLAWEGSQCYAIDWRVTARSMRLYVTFYTKWCTNSTGLEMIFS